MPRIFTANIVVHPSQNEPKKNEFLLSAPLEKEDGNIKLLHIRISQFFFILDCTAQLVYDVSFFFFIPSFLVTLFVLVFSSPNRYFFILKTLLFAGIVSLV